MSKSHANRDRADGIGWSATTRKGVSSALRTGIESSCSRAVTHNTRYYNGAELVHYSSIDLIHQWIPCGAPATADQPGSLKHRKRLGHIKALFACWTCHGLAILHRPHDNSTVRTAKLKSSYS
ncbi:hypothetical protein T265_00623 [Opisthorchis viverrini]|uniref:Uncharacterized protein n=1 Tax=Opisthorchis viverrini TaxID=6198 RepID=A0A075A1A0_OPIVI|nr:hypothetical protein T265_00623 [Opisthorchis viverrini]KER33508.1 hypothetical protein T265_00623 [Opisthorchis viverrini]